MRRPVDDSYPITGDRASHAEYGVGPATDYGVPVGTAVVAPFPGRTRSYTTGAGGLGIILEGTKELPRRVLHPKRKTIGLRVPDHSIALALLEELREPILTLTLMLPGDEAPLTEGWEIQDRLDDVLELIIDGGYCGTEPTTVIDLTSLPPSLIRAGRGDLGPFGLEPA